MTTATSEAVTNYAAGVHVDRTFLKKVQEDLEELQVEVYSEEIKTIVNRWKEGCGCSSQDGSYSDDEDLTYCPNVHSEDKRTHLVLDELLPMMQVTLHKYLDLLSRMTNKSETSRQRDDAKKALFAQWFDDTDDSFYLPSESQASSDDESCSSADEEVGGVCKASHNDWPTALPAELLGHILRLAQRDDDYLPIVFSQVNNACREFAINMPILWSTIDLNYSMNRVALHLARSCGTPLEVRLCLHGLLRYYEMDESPLRHVKQFIATLSPFYHRIRSLTATLMDGGERTEPSEQVVLEFLYDSNLKSLEVLDIGREMCSFRHTIMPDEKHFDKGWPVRKLHLRSQHASASSRFFSTNLTHLHFFGDLLLDLDELIEILSKTTSLRQLIFENLRILDDDEEVETTTSVDNLAELQFLDVSNQLMLYLTTHIHTPQLVSLRFSNQGLEAPLEEHPLITLTSSNRQLKRVDLDRCDMTPSDWTTFLQSLPELIHLRVASSALEEAHLEALRDGPETCCPKLHSITLDNEFYLTSFLIRAIVEARAPVIRSLVLRGWDESNVDSGDVEALRATVPWVVLDTFIPEIARAEREGGSSEESDWMEDEFTDSEEEEVD